ncbi:hypothetical protein POM88_046314 [Heracleum sosnowskyi]|uniref:Uncharacterized protein n=1 Tax=Heracleum sosnowskyi TaxID=360622 RepID=A0AAD8H924_9APIA|nr:hypothetical protein POM88_046314 [Heracleum sosnowskyi]
MLKECFCLENLVVNMEYGFLHTLGLLAPNFELFDNSINDFRRGSFGLVTCRINCDKKWVRISDVDFLRSKARETTCLGIVDGHPDKLCDQISDVVACWEIGFVYVQVGLDDDNIEQQCSTFTQGGHGLLTKKPEEIGAGDQSHSVRTLELMPLTVSYENDHGAMVTIRVQLSTWRQAYVGCRQRSWKAYRGEQSRPSGENGNKGNNGDYGNGNDSVAGIVGMDVIVVLTKSAAANDVGDPMDLATEAATRHD